MRMARHMAQLDLNYTKSPICHQPATASAFHNYIGRIFSSCRLAMGSAFATRPSGKSILPAWIAAPEPGFDREIFQIAG